jgi:hypothetical protein
VWRHGFEVFHGARDLDEATALEAAASGDPLSRICAAFAGREQPATAAFAAIVGWFDEGWVAAVIRSRAAGQDDQEARPASRARTREVPDENCRDARQRGVRDDRRR